MMNPLVMKKAMSPNLPKLNQSLAQRRKPAP